MKKSLALLALAASLALPSLAADKPIAADKATQVNAAIKSTEDALKALASVRAELGAHSLAADDALNTALLELKAGLAEAKLDKSVKRIVHEPTPPAPSPNAPTAVPNSPMPPLTAPGDAGK